MAAVADDVAGAVRRTPRPYPSTGDHQTPETAAPVAPGATNPATPVSPDAGTGTGDLRASLMELFRGADTARWGGPQVTFEGMDVPYDHFADALLAAGWRAPLPDHEAALGELRRKLAEEPDSVLFPGADEDMEAYAALPECTACGGTGKDDHGTVFEAPLAVHFAGPPVKAERRVRQLCMWCGHVLIDVALTRDTAPPEWPVSALIKVEDGVATVVPHEPGGELPPGCCALPDEGEPVCICTVESTRCPDCTDKDQADNEPWCDEHGHPADRCTYCDTTGEIDETGSADPEDVRALRFHLASVHKVANAFDLLAIDLDDIHQHDHSGPCGLRNHDVADRSYDEAVARAVAAEADDGAQETRAAANWPAEPVNTHADEQEADRA